MDEKKIRQAIESARCRKYYLWPHDGFSFGHQKKAKKQCELMETTIWALKKQLSIKPKEYEDRYYACECGNILLPKWKKYPTELMPKSEGLPYCMACGQKLDWGDTDDRI